MLLLVVMAGPIDLDGHANGWTIEVKDVPGSNIIKLPDVLAFAGCVQMLAQSLF